MFMPKKHRRFLRKFWRIVTSHADVTIRPRYLIDMGADPAALNLQQEINVFFFTCRPFMALPSFSICLEWSRSNLGMFEYPDYLILRDEHLIAIWRFSKVEGLWPIAMWWSLQVYHWIWAKPLYRGSHHLGCLPWSWYVDHAPPKFWFHGPIRSPKCFGTFGTSQWGRTRLLTLPSSNLPRKSPGPSFPHKKKSGSESGSSCER